MVSSRPLISKSSSPCTNPLVTVTSAPFTIIIVSFMFHSFFVFFFCFVFSVLSQELGVYFYFLFSSILLSSQLERQIPLFSKFFFFFLFFFFFFWLTITRSGSLEVFIFNLLFSSFETFSHQHQLMVFHWSLRDNKTPKVSKTLLSILADLNNAVVWMVTTRALISNSSRPFTNPLVTVTERTNYNWYHRHFHVP